MARRITGIIIEVIDPTMLNDSCDLGIKTRVSNSGQQLWSVDDPVHLTSEGYRDLADIIVAHIRATACEDSSSLHEASSSGSSNKRRLPEPVITRPRGTTPKRGRVGQLPKVADWLVGRIAVQDSKPGWHRGNARSGWRGSRGGPSWRSGGRSGRRGRWWRWSLTESIIALSSCSYMSVWVIWAIWVSVINPSNLLASLTYLIFLIFLIYPFLMYPFLATCRGPLRSFFFFLFQVFTPL